MENNTATEKTRTMVPTTIVLARLEDDVEIVEPFSRDWRGFPVTRPVKVAKSLMWLRRGGAGDLVKARAFAATEGYSVFLFPPSEADPLGRAKGEVSK